MREWQVSELTPEESGPSKGVLAVLSKSDKSAKSRINARVVLRTFLYLEEVPGPGPGFLRRPCFKESTNSETGVTAR